MNDEGQSSKQDDKREHLWMVQVDPSNPSLPEMIVDILVKDTDLNKEDMTAQNKGTQCQQNL